MKKTCCKLINCLFLIIISCSLMFCGCGDEKNDKISMLNPDNMCNSDNLTGLSGMYNKEYKYFLSPSGVYYRLDNSGNLTIECRNASCEHNDKECEAYSGDGRYFVYNNRMYKSNNDMRYMSTSTVYEGSIIDVDTGKKVFDNPVPDEMDKDTAMDDSSMIYSVRVLDKDYIKVEGYLHAYILDKSFNIICWYGNVGKFDWGMIDGDDFYYVNDINQLTKASLSTGELKTVGIEEKIYMAANDDKYIFFSNEYGELYKYDIKEETSTKIANDATMFSVHGDYVYCVGQATKTIVKKDGAIVCDYTKYENMGADEVIMIDGKIYTCFDGGVAQMDADGKNYKEYTLG